MNKILKYLFDMQDTKYAEFQSQLIPTIDKKFVIGNRTPELKKLAKYMAKIYEDSSSNEFLINSAFKNMHLEKAPYLNEFAKSKNANIKKNIELSQYKNIKKRDVEIFLNSLPHKYFDENQLHALILTEIKDFVLCLNLTNNFLGYINNWASCDQLSPKCFTKNKNQLLKYIFKWIKQAETFKVRFAIKCLMQYYLDEDFDKKYLEIVANIKFSKIKKPDRVKNKNNSAFLKTKNTTNSTNKFNRYSVEKNSDEYYVEMMRAWYFATALAKQYKLTFPYIKNKILNPWTHNKTIQKAIESFRITDSEKEELKKYKI